MAIDLNNIEQHSVPLENYIANWFFTDENGKLAPIEHRDQIFALTEEAANFLWNYEMTLWIGCSERYFKTIFSFNAQTTSQQAIKKYLYNLGIPFRQKVFIATQPHIGFVLTWKMVIKYSHNLFFAYDQSVWDRSLSWMLDFHHDDIFTFCKDLIHKK